MGVNYNSCVRIAFDESGLELRLFRLFAAHPPLLIPWSAFESCVSTRLWGRKTTQLSVSNAAVVLCVHGMAGAALYEFVKARSLVPVLG